MLFSRTNSMAYNPIKLLLKSLNIQYRNKVLSSSFKSLACETVNYQKNRQILSCRYFCVSTDLKVKKVTITFQRHDGTRFKKIVKVGEPINEIFDPEEGEIPGFGACLGNQECATCHVICPRDFVDKLQKPMDEELDTVCYANSYDPVLSRLGCCVNVTEDMDGTTLIVPEIKEDKRNQD